MIPEIVITCNNERLFINSITVEQYKQYAELMQKNDSDRRVDAMFFNKKIIQEIFGNRMSLDEIGEMDAAEFITAVKKVHFIMQDIVTERLLKLVEVEQVEKEESAFDEYDIENGYEEEAQEENPWKLCGEMIDRVIKIAIRLLQNSYSQCMRENIMQLLEYLKFELDTIDENAT